MPRERFAWLRQRVWNDRADAQLRRNMELAEGSTRYDVKQISATGTVDLTWPQTMLEVDTSGGDVTVTLPAAADVVGYCMQVVKTEAANTVTVDADGSETISGSATVAWTTQHETRTIVSNGAGWRIV